MIESVMMMDQRLSWQTSLARHLKRNYQDQHLGEITMIRKLKTGEYRLYSRKKNPKTGKRRNLGTFKSLAAAQKHERAVQYFKHH
jgi:hypothetical protein